MDTKQKPLGVFTTLSKYPGVRFTLVGSPFSETSGESYTVVKKEVDTR